ncbi:MAG: sensor histidine kinase [Candidatus Pacebacteria bacterium]|nr:sensor histidine kinase [Candidatus Paceibacterota bacterium]
MSNNLGKFLSLSMEFIVLEFAVVVAIILGVLVYRSNKKSATGRIFILLNLSSIFWLITTYVSKVPNFPLPSLLLGRLAIFFAAPLSSLFFLLGHTFPSEKIKLKKPIFIFVIIATLIMMALNISPYAFTDIKINGTSISPIPGQGLIPFTILSTIFAILAVYFLIKHYKSSIGVEKKQIGIILSGIVTMLILIISTVLIPILFFDSGLFIPLTPIYALIFLGMTSYAIVHHHLFNTKVIATEALSVIIWIILFSKALTSESASARIIDVFVLAVTIIFGILLIKSVRKEVEQREKLQELTVKLEATNVKLVSLDKLKTEFLSFASHQVKTPMIVVKGFAQLIYDGTYGKVSPQVKETSWKIKQSADKMIVLVNNILDLSKIEEGKMSFKFEDVDINKMVTDMSEELKFLASKKDLVLKFHPLKNALMVKADIEKIRQVFQNLIDNSIKYTPKGSVGVVLKDDGDSILFSVIDTGIGLSKELQINLFQRFVRDEKIKSQIQGTGLGLYIAKQIVEAHKGKIWSESDGEGLGSRFFVKLPKTQPISSLPASSELSSK